MKNLFKKTLSVLLAVVMTFTITLPAFAEENSAPETQTEQELGYNSSNALGDAIVSAINEEDASRDEYDGMGIFNVSLIGLEAQVALSAPDGCTVVVAVYEEETMQMVTSGKADVCSDDTEVIVTLADFELPDFFVVKAFILNSENAPVCPSYVDLYNTKAYVEAMSKTTEDFDSNLVINLDDSATDNFAVVTDNALSVQSETDKNVLVSADEENGIYVIENADSSVLALNVGDILYFTYGEGANDYILTKIGKMETKNGLTTITAADDCEMSEFFDYVDIDTLKYNEPQTYSLRRDFDEESGQLTQTKSFPITTGSAEKKFSGSNWSLTFNLDGDVSFYVKFFYDVNLFTKDYYEFSYWVQVGAEAKVTFDFNASFEKKVTLIDADFTIVPGLDIHFALRFTVKASASLNVTGTVTFFMKNGASRNSDGVQQKIEQKPTVTFAADVSGSFSIDLIPELETGFRIVKVFFVDLNVPVDFNVTGTLFVPTTAEDKAKHGCIICVDGKIKVTVSLTISVKFGLKRDKAKSIISFTPVNKPIPLGSFYMSGSGSGIKFGWGECPNINSSSGGSVSGGSGSGSSGSGSSGTGGSDSDVEDTRPVTSRGTCGNNLTWTLYEDGELVIDGTGAMMNYSINSPSPWYSYRSAIKSVIIGNSVKTIGNNAFYECTSLTSVTIPDSVTIIGYSAFDYCDSLTSVTIGNSVKTISGSAFWNCDSLTSVTIPDSVTTIGSTAFGGCKSLTSVTIPDSVKTIGNGAFHNCDSLKSVTIPDSVTTIGNGAFGDCKSLTSVIIGNNVKTIGDSVFDYCTSLKSVTIPDSVTSISDYAFYNCTNLATVYYTGTQEQWDSISIGSGNTPLINANIICSDTVAPAMFMLMSFNDEIAAYSPRAAVQSETVTSAILGNSYVILVVKDKNAEDLLAAENLIYIDQKIAESETFTFDFDLNGETDYDVIITNAELYHSHKYTVVVTAPDCTEQGYTTYTCYCGDTYTDSYIDALGHTEEIISGTPADCINEGITDGIICSVCKTELTEQELILAKGHTNTNGDNHCDMCGFDLSEDCSHICHSNSAFIRFFWKIALFFNKLFNIQSARYCDCGVAHW